MYFGLTDEQEMIRDSLRGTLARTSGLDVVRAVAEAGDGHGPAVWRALRDHGVTGLVVPEEHGGAGLGLLDAAVVAEELGRHVAPVPFLSTAVLAPLALRRAGSRTQRDEWLPRLAAGSARLGLAVSEAAAGRREDAGVRAVDGRLHGRALFAHDADGADGYIVGDDDGNLHLIEAASDGLERIALTTVDRTRAICELRFSDAAAEPLRDGADTLADILDAGRVMLAADSLGAGETMLARAVDYAGERKQFNRVIGSFQAVKHMCAEMAAELQPCRGLVWYAAHAFDQGLDDRTMASLQAKSHVDEVCRFVARTATEVHGGIGFTDLLGLHYWYKRAGANRAYFGGPEYLRRELARVQGFC